MNNARIIKKPINNFITYTSFKFHGHIYLFEIFSYLTKIKKKEKEYENGK